MFWPTQYKCGELLGEFPGCREVRNGLPRWLSSKESTCQCRRLWSLVWEGPLGKEMPTCSSILAWEIPWTEEAGRLQSKRLRDIANSNQCFPSPTTLGPWSFSHWTTLESHQIAAFCFLFDLSLFQYFWISLSLFSPLYFNFPLPLASALRLKSALQVQTFSHFQNSPSMAQSPPSVSAENKPFLDARVQILPPGDTSGSPPGLR